MNELIAAAVFIAALYGGTVTGTKIYDTVRTAALTKAAQGLPKLSPFAAALTKKYN